MQRQTVLLAVHLGFETVLTLTRAYECMDATPNEYSFLILAKACSHAAYTGSRTRTGLACTDDSYNVDSILVDCMV
jgi:hypothetical protein